MLKTKLVSRRGKDDENWNHAVNNGALEKIQGVRVLMLGQADYILVDGKVLSINSDYFEDKRLGLRWVVNPECVGTEIDRLALEFFGVPQ